MLPPAAGSARAARSVTCGAFAAAQMCVWRAAVQDPEDTFSAGNSLELV